MTTRSAHTTEHDPDHDPRALADILRRRSHWSDVAERDRLLGSLDRLAEGRPVPEDHEVVESLTLLSRSSLASMVRDEEDEDEDGADEDDRDAVADILDGEAASRWIRHDHRGLLVEPGGPDDVEPDPHHAWTVGAARDWCREIRRRLRGHPRGTVLATLAKMGFEPRGDLGQWSLTSGEDAAKALVHALDVAWSTGNYRHLYRSARLDLGYAETPGRVFSRIKGVTGAVTADPRSAAIEVESALGTPPWSVARRRLVTTLGQHITADSPTSTVLVGDTGAGKSLTAHAAGDRARAGGAAVFAFPADDGTALVVGLQQVAIRLGLSLQDIWAAFDHDFARHAAGLWRLLDASSRSWVVVLDDAGPDAVGHPAWTRRPQRGHVVVTTRHGDQGSWRPSTVVDIDGLDVHDGARMLLDRLDDVVDDDSRSREEKAQEISKLLSGVPVALVVVGELVARSDDRALTPWLERLVPSLPGGAVATVYDLALSTLGPHRGDGRLLLRLLASFAPDEPVPMALIGEVAERRWTGAGATLDGLEELVRVGLARRSPGEHDGETVRVHAAIAEHARRDLDDPVRVRELDHRAVELLVAWRRRLDAGRPAAWPALLALTPHVAELVESPAFLAVGAPEPVRAEVLDLADKQAQALVRIGQPESAAGLLDRAAVCFRDLRTDHPVMLSARLTAAWMVALRGIGDLPEAERRLEAIVAATTAALGDEHPTTLAACDTLAWARAEQDDHERAEELFTHVLTVRRRILPADHRETLATRHRLAWVRAMRGDHEGAHGEFVDVLARRRDALGADHLDVWGTTYRLAWLHSRLGNHAVAISAFDRLLDDVGAVLDGGHPLTHLVRSRCAWARMWAGDLRTAVEMYAEHLPEQEKVLGPGHPRRLIDANNHAALTLQLGDADEAEQELREIVGLRSELLGVDHPLTLDSRELHAWALLGAGRAEVAHRELVAVLSDRRRTLGPRNESTLATRYRLLRVQLHLGRVSDAEQRARQLLVDLADEATIELSRPHVPGPTRAGVATPGRSVRSLRLSVEQSLAKACCLMGRVDEARARLARVVAERREYLGDDHRDTLLARHDLAWTTMLVGRLDEGAADAEAVLTARERVLGAGHPHTMSSRSRVALSLLLRGRTQAGLAAFETLVDDAGAHLGADHLLTLRARHGRVQALRLVGRAADAYDEAAALFADQERVQGPEAVDTLRAREQWARAAAGLGRRDEAIVVLRSLRRERESIFGTPNHHDVRRAERLLRAVAGEDTDVRL